MKFLLTNDDGYFSRSLLAVMEVLKEYGDVYVSAPLSEKSGTSASISFGKNISVKKIHNNFYAVDGTPADSVSFGLYQFKDVEFDFIVSGCNVGYNQGKDTLFSGTIGACIVASLEGHKAIALSTSSNDSFEVVKEKTKIVLDYIFENKLTDYTDILNVNYPRGNKVIGFKVGRIINVKENKDILLENGVEAAYKERQERLIDHKNSDVYYTSRGYFSITPLKPSLEDLDIIDKFTDIIEKR